MKILIVNAGSSSLKFTLYDIEKVEMLAKGLIERINTPHTRLRYSNQRDEKMEKDITAICAPEAVQAACDVLVDKEFGVLNSLEEIEGIGHRVVHGGSQISDSALITEDIKHIIKDCFSIAPLHNPPNYEGIEACERLLPHAPNVAVFDTAFHQSMPPKAFTYAIPADIAEKHKIRRYGFHGTSHAYVAITGAKKIGKMMEDIKIVTVHLGNGCSMSAVDKGKVVDTSMGLTPLEGLVMGTRCGDIDPAVVLTLMELGYSSKDIDKMLNKSSGMLGLAQIGSNDLRDIMKAMDEGSQNAKLAVDVFCYRILKYVGAYAAVLNGFDLLIFTAGIGENCPLVRAEICNNLTYMGVEMDEIRNNASELIITKEGSQPVVMVLPTNEELRIAQETARILKTRA